MACAEDNSAERDEREDATRQPAHLVSETRRGFNERLVRLFNGRRELLGGRGDDPIHRNVGACVRKHRPPRGSLLSRAGRAAVTREFLSHGVRLDPSLGTGRRRRMLLAV